MHKTVLLAKLKQTSPKMPYDAFDSRGCRVRKNACCSLSGRLCHREWQTSIALMAPTEILAEQHANTFKQWLEPLGIKVGWLAGKQKG